MKELKASEVEEFKQYLVHLADNAPRNLNLFFDVRMFDIKLPVTVSDIVIREFPRTQPEKAQIFECSPNSFADEIIDFFSHLESASSQTQFKIAYEFLEALKVCIEYEQSKIWKYLPDESTTDELYDYIGWGFTYIIVDENELKCILLHGGYID